MSLADTINAADDRPSSTGRLVFVAVLAVVLVVGALVVPIPFHGRAAVALGDLVHGPLFLCVTLGVLYFLQRLRPINHSDRRHVLVRCVAVFLLCSGFGVGMELVQKVIGRSAAIHDALANSLGAFAAVCLYVGWNRRDASKRWALWVCLGAVLILTAWYRPLIMLADVYRAQREFPVLCDFSSNLALTRWYCDHCAVSLATEHATDKPFSMRIDFQPAEFPSATLIDFPKDWKTVEALHLDVTLDSEHSESEVEMMLKVIDRNHATDHTDTVRKAVQLRPGETESIQIERGDLLSGPDLHELDLSDIEFLSIALVQPKLPTTIYVDALRLTLQ